jgi:DNA primase
MSVQMILDRLDKLRSTGRGRWMAACPAHDDRTPSLSVRETDDGRVLIHCFAECAIEDVLEAMGLTVSDLFDRPLQHHAGRARMREPARDLLELLSHEINVAMILLTEVVEGKGISAVGWERLAQAARCIGHARNSVHGR